MVSHTHEPAQNLQPTMKSIITHTHALAWRARAHTHTHAHKHRVAHIHTSKQLDKSCYLFTNHIAPTYPI